MSDDSTASKPVAPRRKMPALGRGLGALLGETRREEPIPSAGDNRLGNINSGGLSLVPSAGRSATRGEEPAVSDNGLSILPISAIKPHPLQPRRHFDEAALEELASSIAQRGVIQPIVVHPHGDGQYQLVAGERRWRAAQKANLTVIPAIVRNLTEREVMALALIENLQREDLNPLEEARAYQRLIEDDGLTQADIARMVDKSRSHVANILRLLALPEPVMAHVEQGSLSMGHARALVGTPNASELAQEAIDKQYSVRDVEKIVRRQSRGEEGGTPQPTRRRAREERDAGDTSDLIAIQNHLEEILGLSVKINADADPRTGSVTIRYHTIDQLDLICERLTGSGI